MTEHKCELCGTTEDVRLCEEEMAGKIISMYLCPNCFYGESDHED